MPIADWTLVHQMTRTHTAKNYGTPCTAPFSKWIEVFGSRVDISQYFHLPITEAAFQLRICTTLLKKTCREYGLERWPHRKINSIRNLVNRYPLDPELAEALRLIQLDPNIRLDKLLSKRKRNMLSECPSQIRANASVKRRPRIEAGVRTDMLPIVRSARPLAPYLPYTSIIPAIRNQSNPIKLDVLASVCTHESIPTISLLAAVCTEELYSSSTALSTAH